MRMSLVALLVCLPVAAQEPPSPTWSTPCELAAFGAQDPDDEEILKKITEKLDKQVEGWSKGETEHYVIHAESGQKILDQYKLNMELMFSEYSKAFQFKDKLPRKARVHIHKDRDSYLRAGAPGSSVAYYSHKQKLLVSYENWELLQFMAHEATHQFFDLAFPSFFNNEDVPMWFSEGIAECFCNCEVRGKTFFINVLNNCENAARSVDILQAAIKAKEVPSVKDMLAMSGDEFRRKAGDMYPISWSFCHFLWNYPGVSEGKGQYREVIINLVNAFKAGKNRDEAYKDGFVVGKKALNLDQIDGEWRTYIKSLRAKHPPKPKGVKDE